MTFFPHFTLRMYTTLVFEGLCNYDRFWTQVHVIRRITSCKCKKVVTDILDKGCTSSEIWGHIC